MKRIHINELQQIFNQHLSATVRPKAHKFLASLEQDFGQTVPVYRLEEIISGVSEKIFGYESQVFH